ncbi:MAG TPA: tetratricopeptide repeat protein [Azospirillum sp.]|nr:tetratricopeptide repeat protein [Azospirillum sp.]
MRRGNRLTPPDDIGQLLTRAVALHQDGKLAEAALIYERVLRQAPRQADALHLLGLVKEQTGAPADGIALIGKAIAVDGGQPVFHLNLGRILERLGRWAEAAEAYAGAVRLAPGESEPLLLAAQAAKKAGRLDAAAAHLGHMLSLHPENGDCALALGDVEYDRSRWAEAAVAYRTAVALLPDPTLAAYNLGMALRNDGLLSEAVAAMRTAALHSPLLQEVWEQSLSLHHTMGSDADAATAGRVLLSLVPGHAAAAKLMGSAYLRLGDAEPSARWLARSATLDPVDVEALLALGALRHEQGNCAGAERCYRRALAVTPSAAAALVGHGVTLASLGRGAEAQAAMRHAVRLVPEDSDTAVNAGSVSHAVRHSGAGGGADGGAGAGGGGALDALGWFRRALVLRPDSAFAWINVGALLAEGDQGEAATVVLQRALTIGAAEHAAAAWSNLGLAGMVTGRHADAVAAFRRALSIVPGDASMRSNLLFCLCFTEDAGLDEVFAEHRAFERFVRPATRRPPAEPTVPQAGRRLRIGYLSPDFQRYPGPGYHFLLPPLTHHDRTGFEIFCYYNDMREDEATRRFQELADGWRACAHLSDEALDARIRADGIDILVDCGGHMARNRMPLFLGRPAPVQISFPLYPNTTGLTAMDYQFADPLFAPPSADALHSEALIRLPSCVLCYRPADSAFAPPDRAPGLEDGTFTFGSFNNPTKLNASTISLWARVLHAVPHARLMLKWRGLTSSGLGRRLRDQFAAQGIAGDRLILSGTTPDPYESYRRIDCGLDPVFANGGTTTCDSLWMGVPVLSIAGTAAISRWGVSLLSAVGLPDLVAADADSYVALAARLAVDRDFLAAKRAGLRARMQRSPLMDERGYTRALEAGYRAAWRRRCDGHPAAAMALEPAS